MEKIITMKTGELIPYKNNPRKNETAVDAVLKSIKAFGFKVPIVIDSKNVVICGHTRLKAAIKLGLEDVPCIIASDLTEAQIQAFRLADNKVAEIATWEKDVLREELLSFESIDLDMKDFGFVANDMFDEKDIVPLADRYIVPPFSVIDGRQEALQNKCQEWEAILGQTGAINPLLCEIIYHWFCTEKGSVYIHPFNDDSTPQKVAQKLALQCDNSNCDLALLYLSPEADKEGIKTGIEQAFEKLKNNAFLVVVASNRQDNNQPICDTSTSAKECAFDTGLKLLNEIFWLEPYKKSNKQAVSQFNAARRLAHTYKNILVLVKGNEKQINLPKY